MVDGHVNAPLGARGGLAARGSEQYRRTSDGELQELAQSAQVHIHDGESIEGIACGGGGYGDPRLRDPARVRHDVAEGLVTARRAAEVYGVEPGET